MLFLNSIMVYCTSPFAFTSLSQQYHGPYRQVLPLSPHCSSDRLCPLHTFAFDHAAAARKDLRVLLPFTSDSLRIPDELSAELGSGTRDALVIGPSGGEFKVWPVEVRRDSGGALLGRGWPEFAAACGAGVGWFLVLRHRGRGVLTIKTFDASRCLREHGAPAPTEDEATTNSKGAPSKLQFISTLSQDCMEKMLIPAKFVQFCIPKENLNNMAVIFGPLGKICQIELEINQLCMFFGYGWSQFLSFHGITGADALLFRYEGNMVFTVKVFQPNGCLRMPKHEDIRMQQVSTLPESGGMHEKLSPSIQKHESKKDRPSKQEQNIPNGSMTYLKNRSKFYCVYHVGPPAWMKKVLESSMIENHFSLPRPFCDAIGFQEPCMITLQASTDSTRLWQVQGDRYNNGSCQLGSGWKSFCQDMRLKEGDVLTINVIQTTLWHVDVTRCNENINQTYHEQQENPPLGRGEKMPNGAKACLSKSRTRCVYDIGPPAWIKKEINTSTIEEHLFLPAAFCDAIGLQETCLITLKSSICSTRSWQVRVTPRKGSYSHRVEKSGWARFFQENELKVGDVCTFNIVETRLWHVLIQRC